MCGCVCLLATHSSTALSCSSSRSVQASDRVLPEERSPEVGRASGRGRGGAEDRGSFHTARNKTNPFNALCSHCSLVHKHTYCPVYSLFASQSSPLLIICNISSKPFITGCKRYVRVSTASCTPTFMFDGEKLFFQIRSEAMT